MDDESIEETIIRYYKLSDRIKVNEEKLRQIDFQIEFYKIIQSMVEKLKKQGMSEGEAFEKVKKLAIDIAKLTPDPPKDPLQ